MSVSIISSIFLFLVFLSLFYRGALLFEDLSYGIRGFMEAPTFLILIYGLGIGGYYGYLTLSAYLLLLLVSLIILPTILFLN